MATTSSIPAFSVPTLFQSIALLSSLFVLLVASVVLYNIFLHPLRSYPGPLLWRASRIPWVLALQRGELHSIYHDLHTRYGPVVRVAPNELSFIDSSAWKDIYLNPRIQRADVWFRKQKADEPLSIMGADEAAHAKFKRAFWGAFGDRGVRDFAPVMERYVGAMMGKFREKCGSEREAVVEMNEWLEMVSFDVSGELSFGSSFGSVEAGKPHEWVQISKEFGKGVIMIASVNHYPLIAKNLKWLLPKKLVERVQYHKQLTHEKVAQRMNGTEGRKDVVQSVVEYNREQIEKGKEAAVVTPAEIELNMAVIVFAASDTTVNAVASTLWHLLQNGEWLSRVVEELKENFGKEQDIQAATTKELEVLTAVLSEGMRIGPPVSINVPRIIGKGGEIVCGRRVPEGTLLAMNPYASFRSPLNFDNPDVFDPGRFMQDSGVSPPGYYPFLLGRHACLGEKLAWATMRVLLARLLFVFDVSLASRNVENWGEQKTFILWEKAPLEVRLKLR